MLQNNKMKKILLLFDVDGTIALSGQKIHRFIRNILNVLAKNEKYDLGIVGGGTFEKILSQIEDVPFQYIFSECGSVYHLQKENGYELQYQNMFLNHETFSKTHFLIKKSLEYISEIMTTTSGHFVDVRQGLIYISLIGLQATQLQREEFCLLDMEHQYRQQLLLYLKDISKQNGTEDTLQITIGGRTGIAIYPKEWNKTQVLQHLPIDNYEIIYYYGDKYEKDGNDHDLIHHPNITGIKVNDPEDTLIELKKIFLK